MIYFWLPVWLKTLYTKYTSNNKPTNNDINDLKCRLKQFDVENPIVSIVIPAWNEEENIMKTIASLANNKFDFQCELIVINNNSTDNTQSILDNVGIRSIIETNQGIAPARRRGLLESRGKYHLCCDADTIYPPTWIREMTETLQKNEKQGVACIYGAYSFIPSQGKSRFVLALYETISNIVRSFTLRKAEHKKVMGLT